MAPKPRLHLVDVVARDYAASVEFYRRLGVDVQDQSSGDIGHAELDFGDMGMHIDNEHLAGIYNSSWRTGEQSRVVIGFQVDRRDDVDALYADLTAAGHPGVQPPFDAFWGARYAVVADPDGVHVGLMSPSDDAHRQWPPTPAPAP
jgi:uncharacterized glyoxalase superfamily protein PhnB